MRNIAAKFSKLNIKQPKTPGFYKNEARALLRKYNTADLNFKFLLTEFIKEARKLVDTETIKEIIIDLQSKINTNDVETPLFLRSKIKISKKEYKYQ